MLKNQKPKLLRILLFIIALSVFIVAIYFIPSVKRRIDWWWYQVKSEIFYFFNPPGENPFTPGQQAEMARIVQMTQTAMAHELTATLEPTITPTNYVSPTPTQTSSSTPTPTAIPDSVRLEGVTHEFQGFNNCGPANLSMALSYWNWEGNQYDIAAVLKPNSKDRNVMPYELADYVETQTELDVVIRYGGDLAMIKKFIAAGYPVLIEKGFQDEVPQKGWMGHYGVLTAYDDEQEKFLIQDSYVMANYSYTYDKVEEHWHAFNYVYLVIYPPEQEDDILSILGSHADETYNLSYATQKAWEQTTRMQGKELFFAWYNYGSSLVLQQDFYGAAQAYDRAYAVQKEEYGGYNPFWRITWYQTGPYFAYYNTGRYQDVVDLADITISYVSNEPSIEETWVWRGRAKLALGDIEGAIEDFRTALEWHPGWWVAENELINLEIEP